MKDEHSFKELEVGEQFRLRAEPKTLYRKLDEETAEAVGPFSFLINPQASILKEYQSEQ